MHGCCAPVEDNGQVEHFWLTGVSFDGSKFTGTIDNERKVWSYGDDHVNTRNRRLFVFGFSHSQTLEDFFAWLKLHV